MSIEIRKAIPMPNRPCRWCLGLQDDSVFVDFDLDTEGRVLLVAISFDGFGYCYTRRNIRRMSLDASQTFSDIIEFGDVTSGRMSTLLSQYFRENRDVIWEDALTEHQLV